MTDQNQENMDNQGQNPQSEQPQQPPVIPQQPAQPAPASQSQGQQAQQPQGQPQYQGQPQAQPQSQGQSQYGQQQQQAQYQGQPNYGQQNYGNLPLEDRPNNFMAMNIVATVLGFILCSSCCIGGIIGIVGVVFSNQVNSKFNDGDLYGAKSSAQTAKILGIVSLVVTALGFILQIVTILSAGGIEAFMQNYMDALENLQ